MLLLEVPILATGIVLKSILLDPQLQMIIAHLMNVWGSSIITLLTLWEGNIHDTLSLDIISFAGILMV